jgi:hypothetical protein
MDQYAIGQMAIIVIIFVILFCVVNDPKAVIYVISAVGILLAICTNTRKPTGAKPPRPSAPAGLVPGPSVPPGRDIQETEIIEKKKNEVKMSDTNLFELDKMYGLRNCENVDDRITKFNQRIGDREHQAAIIQARGLHDNSIEPYYREELSAWGASRWWEPDTVLMRKATPEQMVTIQTR